MRDGAGSGWEGNLRGPGIIFSHKKREESIHFLIISGKEGVCFDGAE